MARRQRTKRKTRSPSPQLSVVNTTGFAALPYELYLEIMSYWPPLPVPTEEPTNYDSLDLRERRFTMHALSQTCSSLRRVFLAFLWERIEVYDGMVMQDGPLPPHIPNPETRSAKKVNRKYAEELVRQLETVTIRDPSLAQYVTAFNVLVTDYSVKSVLKEMARCIELLPNLHTVQLDFGFNVLSQGVQNTFRNYTYPQIHTVCLSPQASIFMRSCPNLRRVTAYHGSFWDTHFDTLSAPHFANVETLGITYAEKDIPLSNIVSVMPKLCDITLDVGVLRGDAIPIYNYGVGKPDHYPLNLKFAQYLTNLRHLRTIRIKLNHPNSIYYHRSSIWGRLVSVSQEEMDVWVKKARQVLSQIPDDSDSVKRRVILTRPNGEIKVFEVPISKSTDA